jgi:hypothetical protein
MTDEDSLWDGNREFEMVTSNAQRWRVIAERDELEHHPKGNGPWDS